MRRVNPIPLQTLCVAFTVMLLGSLPAAAQPSGQVSLNLYISPPVFDCLQDPTVNAIETTPCADVVSPGAGPGQTVAVWVFASSAGGFGEGFAGARFGIQFPAGMSPLGWFACTNGAQIEQPGWPNSGTGNAIVMACGAFSGNPNVKLGYFLVSTGSGTGTIRITADPRIGSATYLTANGLERVVGSLAALPVESGRAFLCGAQGGSQGFPDLPSFVNPFGAFVFLGGFSGNWCDPPTVDAYRFTMTGGSLFTEILDFPTGFHNPFTVWVGGSPIGTFGPGQSVDLGGVTEFEVRDILPFTDATDTAAFPIQLAFNTATADFEMLPLEVTIDVEPASTPSGFAIRAAPNPARSRSTFQVDIDAAGHVRLELFDPQSRLVRVLADQMVEPGTHSWSWDGRDLNGRSVGAGQYFYTLRSAGRTLKGKVMVIR